MTGQGEEYSYTGERVAFLLFGNLDRPDRNKIDGSSKKIARPGSVLEHPRYDGYYGIKVSIDLLCLLLGNTALPFAISVSLSASSLLESPDYDHIRRGGNHGRTGDLPLFSLHLSGIDRDIQS